MSILLHPLWYRLVPHLVVVRGDHVRASFDHLPTELADELRLYLAPCLHCGRPCFPVRIRPKIGYEMSGDYLPACAPEVRPACSQSLRVTHEMGKLAMAATARDAPDSDPDPSHSYLR